MSCCQNPGFPANSALAESFGIDCRYYSLLAEKGFQIDLDEIRKLVDGNTRFVLVNSPHNPTGKVLSDEQMAELDDFCAERSVQFVSDEVYHPIYHGVTGDSAARLPHATVIGDFSKALCLSGLRTGWMVDRNPERRARYLNGRNYFTITSPVLSEQLAILAFEHRDAIYARAQQVASRNLAVLDEFFARHEKMIRWIRPEGGMTAYPWLAGGGDARNFCRGLARCGVLIAPGDCFGQPSHFRVGFAASGDHFPQAMELFARFLDS